MAKPLPPAARELLAARARRANQIRKRVIAAAVAAFVLAWCVIAYAGPMGSATTATATSNGSTATSANDESVTTSGSWDDDSSSSDTQLPAVTTSPS
jgi:hypothetical protein